MGIKGNYKDGRTLKKYYCKICNKKIRLNTFLYGSGLCRSCATKKMWENGKRKRRKINYCKDCGKRLSKKPNAKRCKSCAGKEKFKIPENCSRYIDGRTKNKRKYMNNYNKTRKAIDINYKIRTHLRSQISKTLKNNVKVESTKKLLGCIILEFKQYLESKFKPGMSWKNWNRKGWHIDHIRPCASFDLSKPKEQRKCFHYTNLQPLWAKENLRKGDRYEK